MDTFTDLDLLDELSQYHQAIAVRKGGVTPAEFAEHKGVGVKTARKWLEQDRKEGKLTRERCHLGPHSIGWVYYRNEKE